MPTSAAKAAIAPTLVKVLERRERERQRPSWIPRVYEGRRRSASVGARLQRPTEGGPVPLATPRARPTARSTFAASPAASPSSTSRLISANIASTASAPSGSRSAQQDLLGRRRRRALVAVEQLLVELLPGRRADDLDLDVAVGLEARQLDHRAREVDDPHRLAHVQHEHLGGGRAERSRRRASEPVRMISCTASGIVMK